VSGRRAAFLDRDGTIIEDINYIAHPSDVSLIAGAGDAIRALNEHDVAVVVVTNQSGIARGLVTPEQYEAVCERTSEVLAAHGAHIDATYFCPHHPAVSGPCDCRKPGRLLYDRALSDLGLDGAASMFAGDRLRDVLLARTFGGSAFLIRAATTPPDEADRAAEAGAVVVGSLTDAVRRFLRTGAEAAAP